jgi:predicted Zn-dependent protease
MARFVIKRPQGIRPSIGAMASKVVTEQKEEDVNSEANENKEADEVTKSAKKKNTKMDTKEKVKLAQEILGNASTRGVKRLRADEGLIERTTESKIILTEDNRELLTE